MTFGEFARLKRIEAGKSQQVCAVAIGLETKGGYQRLEGGKRFWKLDQVVGFAELLEMKTSQLVAEFEQINKISTKVL